MFFKKEKPVVTDDVRVDELLSRGVVEVVEKDKLRALLKSGERLRVKLGIDPTSSDIHLGRAVVLMKLRDFQELGHQIVLIVGDATGVIGDTSDKESERPMLTREQVEKNAETYFEQVGRVLDMKEVEKHYNSSWLNKLSYDEIGRHADCFSVADFIARDNIKRRLDAGKRVSLREVLYPLMQGYDSIAVQADVELGGTDQRFNLLAGRVLQERFGQDPQQVVMTKLIEGTDGRKMSSSWGNVIRLSDTPSDMYGKVMSLHDDLMKTYFTTLTRIPSGEVKMVLEGSPMDAKKRLAREIVSLYHSPKDGERAEQNFVRAFQERRIPDGVRSVEVSSGEFLVDVLMRTGNVSSKAEFRRLVEAGAVVNMDTKEKVSGADEKVSSGVWKIGKRRFLKILVIP